jgi:two-component system chemotaxis response regulator CheY
LANILIVDDSFLIRKSIKKIVERMGHTVVGETFDGKFLMQKYIQLSPDLITLDIVMVEKNGIAALRDLKERYPSSKVIMVSSVSQKIKVLTALKLGADHFILKPIDEGKLMQVINEVLGDSEDKDKE